MYWGDQETFDRSPRSITTSSFSFPSSTFTFSHNPVTVKERNGPLRVQSHHLATMTTEMQNDQATIEVTNIKAEYPKAMPLSPKTHEYLYGSRGLLSNTNSLNRLMAARVSSTLKASPSALLKDFEKRNSRKTVSFEAAAPSSASVDYGYDQDFVPPPVKRRRYERRNSKTPAMLMAMSASLVALDFTIDKEESERSSGISDDDDSSWDGGLEIAEELVKHLQKRRTSAAANKGV